MAGAFQKNAFQNNAFQVGAVTVGWFDEWDHPRLRHTVEELEGRLRRQKDSTVNARWWDEFLDAQKEIAEVAKRTAREDRRRVIIEIASKSAIAADAAVRANALAEAEQHFKAIAFASHAAANAKKRRELDDYLDVIRTAQQEWRRHLEAIELERDEEEIIFLTMAIH